MPNSAKIVQLPIVSRQGELQSFDPKTNTARMTISNEAARVHRADVFLGEFIEELGHKEDEVDLSRAKAGSVNFLKNHGSFRGARIEDIIGRVYDVQTNGEKIEASVEFATREEVQGLVKDIKAGVIRNVSVGYQVRELKKVGESNDIPILRATNWELLEVSSVAIPADPSAQVRDMIPRQAEDGKEFKVYDCKVRGLAADNKKEAFKMPDEVIVNEEKTKTKVEPQVDLERVREEGIKAERARVESISKSVRAAGFSSDYAQTLIGEGITVDQAREVIFKELEKKNRSVPTPNAHVSIGRDERQSRIEGATNALLYRSNPSRYKLEGNGRRFVGASLLRLAEHFIGPKAMGMTKSQIASRALSTADFTELLSNVAGKSLIDSYDLAPQTFQAWTRAGSLPDFKEQLRVRFGDMPSLKQVEQNAEYEYGSIGEGSERISLMKFGRLLKISWEVVLNDDLNAFSRLPAMMGAAARRLESKLVYTDTLLGNPALGDGIALFHADHANLATSGTAVTEAGLSAARTAMRKQKTLDKEDFLGLTPGFLIVGPNKETEARKLLGGEIGGSTTPDVNIFRNSMQLIVEPRIAGNNWFVSAPTSEIDTLEVATLDGGRGLEIMEQTEFNADVMKMKIRHIVGVKALDYRGLYKNAGA